MTENQFRGIEWQRRVNDLIEAYGRQGRHVVTSGQASANAAAIATGKADATAFLVQIYRAGVNVMSDAAISLASGTLTVADGAATYNMTAGDVIVWQVW